MDSCKESTFTMEGHFDQDDLDIEKNIGCHANNVVTLSGKYVPDWYRDVAQSLYAIIALSENWDSYGARRVSADVAKAVDELLISIMHAHTPAPQIVPSANGNIQLEWHTDGIDLEIEVESLAVSYVFFRDEKNEMPEWDGEIKYDLSKLVNYINILTDRISQ